MDRLRQKSVEIADYLEEQLSAADFVDIPATCPYGVGEAVLFRRPDRHQKRQPPYESGWRVTKVIAPSTVEITSSAGGFKIHLRICKLQMYRVMYCQGMRHRFV